jgi:CHASE3 domain sensor protein
MCASDQEQKRNAIPSIEIDLEPEFEQLGAAVRDLAHVTEQADEELRTFSQLSQLIDSRLESLKQVIEENRCRCKDQKKS